jgi:hypothetical protein
MSPPSSRSQGVTVGFCGTPACNPAHVCGWGDGKYASFVCGPKALIQEDDPVPPESAPPHDGHPENSRVFAHLDGSLPGPDP